MNVHNELFNGVRQPRWQHFSPVVSTFSTFIRLLSSFFIKHCIPLSLSDHFHTDAVVPSSDHCRTEAVLPPSDHYFLETVAPSSDHYGTTEVAPPSEHLHTKRT